MTTTSSRAAIVVDANFTVWALIPAIAPADTLASFEGWVGSGMAIAAPSHWLSECTSALRRLVFGGRISNDEALVNLADLFRMPVNLVAVDEVLCRSALVWADRLRQSRA